MEATSRKPGKPLQALIGVISSAAGIGLAHLIASFYNPGASPIVAVGSAAIDLAPRPLKEFAVRNFGEADKLILIGGVMIALLILTIVFGIVAFRNLRVALVGVLGLGIVGAVAALARPDSTPLSVLPAVAAVLVGGFLLDRLVVSFSSRSGATGASGESGKAESGEMSTKLNRKSDDDASDTTPDADASIELSKTSNASPMLAATPKRRAILVGGTVGLAALSIGGGQLINAKTSSDSALGRNRKLPAPTEPATALPAGVQAEVKGISPYLTPKNSFYRVDTAISVPRISADSWKLEIDGMADKPFTLTYDELLEMDSIERYITLTCVSNELGGPYVGTAKWQGVRMSDILKKAGVTSKADQILATSSDGYTCSTPIKDLTDGRDAMVAYGFNGEPLPVERGFPARVIVPGLYGYVSATKWLVKLTATTFKKDQAYWTKRGWDEQAPIYTMARFDVPEALATLKKGTTTIAGVAWAQERGIKKVEINIDGEKWIETKLATDGGKDLWRQWSYDAEGLDSGIHTIEVRATDATGKTQVKKRQPVFPRGATGWPSTQFSIE